MSQTRTQNLQNHVRIVPLYHFALGGLLMWNLARAVRALMRRPGAEGAFELAMALGLMILFFYARAFATTVQDRVIRLEMRLRLQVLAPDLMPRFGQLAVPQLVALRFAGDAELPGLAREVLDGKLTRSGDIKRRITDWQADWLRA